MLQHGGASVGDPGEAEEFIGSITDAGAPGDAGVIIDALEVCMPVWDQGYRAADAEASNAFIERNRATLDAQQEYYADSESLMGNNKEFMNWLRLTAGAIYFNELVSASDHPLEEKHELRLDQLP